MNTLFEKQGVKYEMQGDYRLPCGALSQDTTKHIGVWGCGSPVETSAKQKHRPSRQARQRHRRFLKSHHRVRYYNLLTSGTLNGYLADLDKRAEKMFVGVVKSLAENEGVTEELKAAAPMEWVQKMNNIRNRATEIVNAEVVFA